MSRTYDNFADLITFSRASRGTSVRHVRYSDELITNGTFDTDVSGWTAGEGTIEYSSGEALLTRLDGGGEVIATQTITVESGKNYVVSFDLTSNPNNKPIALYDAVAVSNLKQVTSTGTYTFLYTPPSTSFGVQLRIRGAAPSGTTFTATVDNISVKQITLDDPADPLLIYNHFDDEPRIDFDPVTGDRKGLLIEESRTNLVPSSEDFSGYGWFDGGSSAITLTSDYSVSPDGQTTADRVEYDGTLGVFESDIELAVSISGGTASKTFTFSLYVKSNSGTQTFRLKNTHGGIADNFSSDFTATSEWQRFEFTVTNNASAGTGAQILAIMRDSSANPYDVSIFGAQLEEGSFPTSYIPTSGATATRSADVADIQTNTFGFSANEGTLFVEADTYESTQSFRRFAEINNDSNFNDSVTLQMASGNLKAYVFSGGSTEVNLTPGSLSDNAFFKGVIGYQTDNVAACLDGGSVSTDTSATMPVAANLTHLNIGTSTGSGSFQNGHIKKIQYFPRRLSDTELQEITS